MEGGDKAGKAPCLRGHRGEARLRAPGKPGLLHGGLRAVHKARAPQDVRPDRYLQEDLPGERYGGDKEKTGADELPEGQAIHRRKRRIFRNPPRGAGLCRDLRHGSGELFHNRAGRDLFDKGRRDRKGSALRLPGPRYRKIRILIKEALAPEMFKTIEWKKDGVVMIDQRLLPDKEVYRTYKDYRGVARGIKTMVIRGAPAIGVAGAMGVALGAKKIRAREIKKFKREFEKIARHMASTRPTAVNLFWGIERMRGVLSRNEDRPVEEIKKRLVEEAITIHDEDIEINKRIGKNGSRLLKKDSTVLTHCNAGALATAGYGTALGVIRCAVERGKNIRVLADETRPFL